MNRSYSDITSRLGEPLWWDEQAVPRYEPFHPCHCGIYDVEVVLARISCQACKRDFTVAFTRTHMDVMGPVNGSLASQMAAGALSYGDPPNIDCCAAGPTMSSDFKEVLEHWVLKSPTGLWARVIP